MHHTNKKHPPPPPPPPKAQNVVWQPPQPAQRARVKAGECCCKKSAQYIDIGTPPYLLHNHSPRFLPPPQFNTPRSSRRKILHLKLLSRSLYPELRFSCPRGTPTTPPPTSLLLESSSPPPPPRGKKVFFSRVVRGKLGSYSMV